MVCESFYITRKRSIRDYCFMVIKSTCSCTPLTNDSCHQKYKKILRKKKYLRKKKLEKYPDSLKTNIISGFLQNKIREAFSKKQMFL